MPHGAPPEISALAAGDHRHPMPIEGQPGVGPASTHGRFVVATFGLLSPGKGIEVAIEAMSLLIERHPEILLVVGGRTHPEIARRAGEDYRLRLLQLVRELDLGDHVTFDDRFLSVPDLAELLASADLFVTTYHAREQAVSGALTFALAAGVPTISTPYRYAEDLLADGAGRLCRLATPAPSPKRSMTSSPTRHTRRCTSGSAPVGAAMSWPTVGRTTAELLRDVVRLERSPEAPLLDEPAMPPLRLDHLVTLVDDVASSSTPSVRCRIGRPGTALTTSPVSLPSRTGSSAGPMTPRGPRSRGGRSPFSCTRPMTTAARACTT